MSSYLDALHTHFHDMSAWIDAASKDIEIPVYSSVDIRDSGFKAAVVDTNLFPAGFNNIDETNWPQTSQAFKQYFNNVLPQAKNILIISEEHTRNKFYAQHILTLQSLLSNAGFEVKTATFLDPKTDSICEENFLVTLESSSGTPLQLLCLHHYLDLAEKGEVTIDAIIYNNDLSSGLPERLANLKIPAFPSPQAGWFKRRKSQHFAEANGIISRFCEHFKLDPWLYSAYFRTEDNVSINEEADCNRLAESASLLFSDIQKKYTEYGITASPTLFLKADSGTYGMGVIPISHPEDILSLNRKARNNLSKGKSSQVISRFLIQEGIPTQHHINNQVAEPCLYLVNNTLVGAFYRLNSQKSETENLNSQGMSFTPWPLKGDSNSGNAYAILAKLSGLAAAFEIVALKET
jgi:glutamate--cysteine ligase